MKSNQWSQLKKGCPSRIASHWISDTKSGTVFICCANNKEYSPKEENECRYQENCPFVYWIELIPKIKG